MGWEAIAAIIAALAATGSAAAQNKSNNLQVEAQDRAQQAERFRQAEIQRQADEDVKRGIQEFTPEKQQDQVQQATQVRTQALQAPAAQTDQYAQAPASTPKEVGSDLGRRLASVATHARQEAAQRAALGAYGDASQQEGFDMNRLRETLQRRRLESTGSSSILPYELRETANKGQNYAQGALLGGLVSSAAGAYSIGAGKKPPASGASPGTPWGG